jgi:hypothetical protein
MGKEKPAEVSETFKAGCEGSSFLGRVSCYLSATGCNMKPVVVKKKSQPTGSPSFKMGAYVSVEAANFFGLAGIGKA